MTLRSNMKSDLQLAGISSQHMMMMKILMLSLLSAEVFFCAIQCTYASEPEPFWRIKPKVLAKITDERAIIVSVKSVDVAYPIKQLILIGGGDVHVSSAQAIESAKKFKNLQKISDYIVEVNILEDQTVFIHTEAFNYHARMTLKVVPDESNVNKPLLKFEVVRGNFLGMKGEFSFEKFKPKATLMGFHAVYEYEKLPMPQFFVEFGLEVILQRVAQKMRTFLEKESAL